MDEKQIEKKLKELNVKFKSQYFKPSKEECNVCEQLFKMIDELQAAQQRGSGVILKPFMPSKLQPIKK